MKTLTLTSEFFQNECAESFCKAILGNECIDGYTYCGFISEHFVVVLTYILEPAQRITFKLDDSFSVDWSYLAFMAQVGYEFTRLYSEGDYVKQELHLDYLATLQGVIIEEVGE